MDTLKCETCGGDVFRRIMQGCWVNRVKLDGSDEVAEWLDDGYFGEDDGAALLFMCENCGDELKEPALTG